MIHDCNGFCDKFADHASHGKLEFIDCRRHAKRAAMRTSGISELADINSAFAGYEMSELRNAHVGTMCLYHKWGAVSVRVEGPPSRAAELSDNCV